MSFRPADGPDSPHRSSLRGGVRKDMSHITRLQTTFGIWYFELVVGSSFWGSACRVANVLVEAMRRFNEWQSLVQPLVLSLLDDTAIGVISPG